jgi:hypothetical protein
MGWSMKLTSKNSYLKLSLILVLIVIAASASGNLLVVYAGGPERDYDERYEDIPGTNECWYDGYADGQDHPFNHDRNEECKDKGNQYYRAFIEGCKSVEGNTEETCEIATDN